MTWEELALSFAVPRSGHTAEGEPDNVLDITFVSGFDDVSNFNRAFRTEFGVSPRAFRQQGR